MQGKRTWLLLAAGIAAAGLGWLLRRSRRAAAESDSEPPSGEE
jgi:hypothetical protein